MMMFLTLLCLSFFVVAVLSAIVYGASPRGAVRPAARPGTSSALGASRFFGGDPAGPVARPRLPVEAVIALLERHVRLEQAAAESFLEMPAADTLYAPSGSQFAH